MRYINFFRYLLPYWKKEILILFLSGVSFVLGLAAPYLARLIIDRAYINRDLRLFIFLVVLAGFIFIVINILNGLINYLNRSIKIGISLALNHKIFKKLQYFSYRFFQDASCGQHLYKLTYDIERVAILVSNILPQIVSIIPKSLFIFGIILYLDRRIALFSIVLLPWLYFVLYFFTKRLKIAVKAWIEDSQRIFDKAQEILSHMQLIKAFGKERREIKSYIMKIIHNAKMNLANTRLELFGSFVSGFSHRVILGLLIVYGGYQAIKGKMTLGTLSAIALYLGQLLGLQSLFSNSLQQISSGLVSQDRLTVILDAQPELKEEEGTEEFNFPKGKVEFKNLTFNYSKDKAVLEGLSFCIEGGSCVAIVGSSGCGKTTIINLLLRLYRPLKGSILIDGFDIARIKSKLFYEQIGVVLQEPYLWNDSVENNIRYGKEGASSQELQCAAEVSCIDEFVNALPDGYNTVIGENACKISEGQKQRIALARAVIKRPKVLILDEALSSVDAQLEERIINNIRTTLKNSTIIVISHRLCTITRMDLVYFLSDSDKIEIGKHEELLQQNIQYRHYLAHQLMQ